MALLLIMVVQALVAEIKPYLTLTSHMPLHIRALGKIWHLNLTQLSLRRTSPHLTAQLHLMLNIMVIVITITSVPSMLGTLLISLQITQLSHHLELIQAIRLRLRMLTLT